MPKVASPCIKLCALDPRSGQCLGCGRTGAEIAAWPAMSDPERAALLARLSTRRDAAPLASPA